MARTLSDGNPVLLHTLPAGRGQRRLALTVVALSIAIFAATAPFATLPLPAVWAFIPIYESAIVINDLVTAVLLLGQFSVVRSPALLVLGGGYLFTAFIAIVHALTFPGLFAPHGMLGAGPQSTAWLYMFWHGGFPLTVIAYALLKDAPAAPRPPRIHSGLIILAAIVTVIVVVVGFTLAATGGEGLLPALMQGNHYTGVMFGVVSSVWALSLAALFCLWRRRPCSVLDLWLMVVMCAWLFDIALSAVLNAGRFDLGFYAGRIYGLLAASFVLVMLLLENAMLHAQLRESEERHRAVVDTAVDGIIVIDEQGVIHRFNPGAERIFGYSEAEVIGKNVSMLMPSPYREQHDGYLARYMATGEKRFVGRYREVAAQRRDGTVFPAYIGLGEMRLGGRRMFTGIARDITEAKQGAERQAHLVTSLEAANKELESFSYSVSHDLRAPLRAIDGFSQILVEDYADRLDGEGHRVLTVIRENSKKMGALIDDLLAFSRLGRKPLALSDVNMSELIGEVLRELQSGDARQAPRIAVEDLPPARGDRVLLKQVWINLLSNALKFAGRNNAPYVEIRGHVDGVENVYSVKDNGAGFDMRYYGKLFGVFQRLHGDDEFPGTGVGLAIVHRVVSRHGGRVWAEGKIDAGATFHFALPRGDVDGRHAAS